MKMYGGVEVNFNLSAIMYGGEQLASCRAALSHDFKGFKSIHM